VNQTGPRIRLRAVRADGKAWCDDIPVNWTGPYIHVRAFARMEKPAAITSL